MGASKHVELLTMYIYIILLKYKYICFALVGLVINCTRCTVLITKYIDFTVDGKCLLLHFKRKYYSVEHK